MTSDKPPGVGIFAHDWPDFLTQKNVLGGQAWYYQQIFRLADDQEADPDLGILKVVGAYVKDELSRSRRVKKARRQPVV